MRQALIGLFRPPESRDTAASRALLGRFGRKGTPFIHGEAPRPPGLAQRLESHVHTDFVAVLEGIRDGLCDAVHAHRLALDAVSLDAFSQGIATEAHNV
jgi:hypothetical protein